MKKSVKVFISYAREDVKFAEKIYYDLNELGVLAWIDFRNLQPGQNWRLIINKTIKECDFFIALLSKNSVTKRGYVQKELKIALNILDEIPDSNVFIIPVRLDECIITEEKLKEIQWVDLFHSYNYGIKKIRNALSLTNEQLRSKYSSVTSEIVSDIITKDSFNRKHFVTKMLSLISLLFIIAFLFTKFDFKYLKSIINPQIIDDSKNTNLSIDSCIFKTSDPLIIVGNFSSLNMNLSNNNNISIIIKNALQEDFFSIVQFLTNIRPKFISCEEACPREKSEGKKYANLLSSDIFIYGTANKVKDFYYDIQMRVCEPYDIFPECLFQNMKLVNLEYPYAAKFNKKIHVVILISIAKKFYIQNEYAKCIEITNIAEMILNSNNININQIRNLCQSKLN